MKEHPILITICYYNENRKRLFAGTLPANKKLFAGTLPAFKKLFAGTLPAFKKLFAGTLPANKKLFAGTPAALYLCFPPFLSEKNLVFFYHSVKY